MLWRRTIVAYDKGQLSMCLTRTLEQALHEEIYVSLQGRLENCSESERCTQEEKRITVLYGGGCSSGVVALEDDGVTLTWREGRGEMSSENVSTEVASACEEVETTDTSGNESGRG